MVAGTAKLFSFSLPRLVQLVEFTVALCLAVPLHAQPVSEVPEDAVPLVAWVNSRSHATPDTLPNFSTSTIRLDQFRALLTTLQGRDWKRALMQAESIK